MWCALAAQTPLTSWLVPVADLEAAAGMTFFSDLLDPSR